MNQMSLRFRKGDILAIIFVVFLAVLLFVLFLPKQDTSVGYAQIYQNGDLIKTVSLALDQELTVSGAYCNTITVSQGKIGVTQSDCPGGDCIQCGWIDGVGRSIVCLPNGLEIWVISGNNDVDFVVG